MKRFTVLCFIALTVLMLGVGATAQDDAVSFCGTFSGSANFLPSVSSSFGLDLTLGFSNFTAMSSTSLVLIPTFSATQSFTLEYALDALTFGSEVAFGVVPLAFQTWDIYTKLDFPTTTFGDGTTAPTFGGYLKADAVILPAFSATGTLYMTASVGPLSASSTSIFGFVPPSFQTQKFAVTIDFLSTTFGETGTSSANGELGAYIDVLPALATTVWLDLSVALSDFTAESYTSIGIIPTGAGTQVCTLTYSLESVTLTSKTTFILIPFAFSSEYLKIGVVYKDLSIYGWGQFATSGVSAGVGFSYDFCAL